MYCQSEEKGNYFDNIISSSSSSIFAYLTHDILACKQAARTPIIKFLHTVFLYPYSSRVEKVLSKVGFVLFI